MRKHPKSPPFRKCGYCDFKCWRWDELYYHVYDKHKDVPLQDDNNRPELTKVAPL